VDKARVAIAWLTELIAFATRRPARVLAYTTVPADGDIEGVSWESAGPIRYARRRVGPPLFRDVHGLVAIMTGAWQAFQGGSMESSGLDRAVTWGNVARSSSGTEFLDIRLLHQWIPLEVLAARWARQKGRDRIVDDVAFEALEASVRGWARQSLGKPERAELYEKVPELARRPAKRVLIDYLAESFLPYPAQPVGEQLSAVVSRSLKARNLVVHDGAMDFDSVGGTSGAWRDLMKISAITERAILAAVGAGIPLLTEVPWTSWRAPS
jgi:hypothetical protein